MKPGRDPGRGAVDINDRTPALPSRSFSLLDDSKLRAQGLTLPPDKKTAKLLELAGKFIARAEKSQIRVKKDQDAVDEGYDSKVSNDTDALDDDTTVSKVAQIDAQSVYTNGDSSITDHGDDRLGDMTASEHSGSHEGGGQPSGQHGGHHGGHHGADVVGSNHGVGSLRDIVQSNSRRDAIAKLIYSQRDKTVYEGSASRRLRNIGFHYAGKEQSRLMETSLNNITPGYLSMHQFANLPNFTAYSTYRINEHEPRVCEENGYLTQQQQLPGGYELLQDEQPSRSLQMTTICIQDANTQENVKNGAASQSPRGHMKSTDVPSASPSSESPSARQKNTRHPRSFKLKHRVTPSKKTPDLIEKGAESEISTPTDLSEANHAQVRINDLDPASMLPPGKLAALQTPQNNHSIHNSYEHPNKPQSSFTFGFVGTITPSCNGGPVTLRYQHKEGVAASLTRAAGVHSPALLDACRTGDSNNVEKLTSSLFPAVGDLLPAVERNLRRQRYHGSNKRQTLYRSQTTLDDAVHWRPAHNQTAPPTTAASDSVQDLHSDSLLELVQDSDPVPRRPRNHTSHVQRVGGLRVTKGGGPPGFRPHHALSPLQRAKEIVTRRLYGHVSLLPDGSEEARVPSPNHHATRMDRINSASRQLERIIHGNWRRT